MEMRRKIFQKNGLFIIILIFYKPPSEMKIGFLKTIIKVRAHPAETVLFNLICNYRSPAVRSEE